VGKWFVIAAALCACSSSTASDTPDLIPEVTSPTGIELPGDPNGAFWDSTNRTLYLTDDKRDLILRRRAQAFEEVATLPPSSGLTGIARLADGRFIVTAFGFGTNGGVFVVDNGKATPVPNLDATRRRSGIAVAPDGTIYIAYFIAHPGGQKRGGIAKLDLAEGETDVVSATDLIKPVGIVATDTTLYVTDQHAPAVLAFARDGSSKRVITTAVKGPDLLTQLPDGALVTGTREGIVYAIDPANGNLDKLASGLDAIRGTAYDDSSKRLFVVEHGRRRLHIIPVERAR
jgi:sugar lactone lactonase YvrE